jgi:hypothetical protein
MSKEYSNVMNGIWVDESHANREQSTLIECSAYNLY